MTERYGIACERALATLALEALLKRPRPPSITFNMLEVDGRPTITFAGQAFALPDDRMPRNPIAYGNEFIRGVVARIRPDMLDTFQPMSE